MRVPSSLCRAPPALCALKTSIFCSKPSVLWFQPVSAGLPSSLTLSPALHPHKICLVLAQQKGWHKQQPKPCWLKVNSPKPALKLLKARLESSPCTAGLCSWSRDNQCWGQQIAGTMNHRDNQPEGQQTKWNTSLRDNCPEQPISGIISHKDNKLQGTQFPGKTNTGTTNLRDNEPQAAPTSGTASPSLHNPKSDLTQTSQP